MDAARVSQAFWASAIVFTLIGIYFYLSQPEFEGGPTRVRRWIDRYIMSRDEAAAHARAARSVPESAENARSNRELEPSNRSNAASESRTDDRTGAFVLNDDQRLAVTRMIYHKVSTPGATKASTIRAGFDVSKGESSRYKEASAIYDALFVLPTQPEAPRFRELDADKRPIVV
jgi:hypothetical protein